MYGDSYEVDIRAMVKESSTVTNFFKQHCMSATFEYVTDFAGSGKKVETAVADQGSLDLLFGNGLVAR